jgi:hypothetical protein
MMRQLACNEAIDSCLWSPVPHSMLVHCRLDDWSCHEHFKLVIGSGNRRIACAGRLDRDLVELRTRREPAGVTNGTGTGDVWGWVWMPAPWSPPRRDAPWLWFRWIPLPNGPAPPPRSTIASISGRRAPASVVIATERQNLVDHAPLWAEAVTTATDPCRCVAIGRYPKHGSGSALVVSMSP